MRNQTPVLLVLLIADLVWFAAQPTAATDIPYDWNNVPPVVAVGDIHRAYDSFVDVLKSAELVDDELRWIGGKAHLVQSGDVLDRGPDSRKCMDWLIELEKRARRGIRFPLLFNFEKTNV